eukprot:TRINITY_DN58_c0_g1_i1.p2 TRINITY_DN58_c0_g1~~TRINITY_DN58_c0_g1_i1.p2  ORF type:complete len:876 (-),score=188.99 TRINITY_DN58_c0_g1_i1:17636-20263(-)
MRYCATLRFPLNCLRNRPENDRLPRTTSLTMTPASRKERNNNPRLLLPPSRFPTARLPPPPPKKAPTRNLKSEPSAHKPLKVTVKLPKNLQPAFRSISPPAQHQQSSTKPKPDAVAKPPPSSSSKSRSKPSRRDKEKLSRRASTTPPPHLTEPPSHNKRRASPAPLHDTHDVKKANPPLLSFRSSALPPPDVNDVRTDMHRPKSTSLSPSSSSEPPKPLLRSSPLPPSERKDATKASDRSRAHNAVEPKQSERRTLKSSPVKAADANALNKQTDSVKAQKSTSRQNDMNHTVSKSARKPPASVPLAAVNARVPRSEPAAFRSSSPDVLKKSDASKLVAVPRASSGRERRSEKNMSRRSDDLTERRRRDDKELPRKRREGSVDCAAPRSKARDAAKRRSRTQDEALSDVDHVLSRTVERDGVGEKERDRLAEMEVVRTKGKDKARKGVRDHRMGVDKDSEMDKSTRRDEKGHERDGSREKDKQRERESVEMEREKHRDGERDRDRDRDKLRSKVAEKPRDRGLKRDLERSGGTEKERERKTMRKDVGHESDAVSRRSKEREDVPSSGTTQVHSRGALGFRSEPADKVQTKNVREAKNDTAGAEKDKDRTKDTTPRKGMLRLRSKPANAIKECVVGESKSTEASRNVKEAASPASTHADPLPRPSRNALTEEELRLSARKLEQLASEQRELLSQFDSLTKLCDDFLSKEKHNDFEETAKSAFKVFFKYCLKKETEMRLRKGTHREWIETRQEILAKYRYLTRQFGAQRISELEKIGRTQTALFLSHQVHKVYVRMFILQRCWSKELRNMESEMRSVMNYLDREGSAVDKNKALTQRKTHSIASLLNDYANIVCLFDTIVSDWSDGDDQAGFELTMPF